MSWNRFSVAAGPHRCHVRGVSKEEVQQVVERWRL